MTNSILIFECDFILGSFLLFVAVMGNFWGGGRFLDKVQKPFSNTCSWPNFLFYASFNSNLWFWFNFWGRFWLFKGWSYLAEQFRQIKRSLAEQFRQIKHSLAEQFRQIKRSLAEQFRQIKRSLAEQFRQIKCSLAEPQYVVEARAKMSLAIMSKILASGCTNWYYESLKNQL